MRVAVIGLAVLGLAGCAPEFPESGPGFSDYQSYAAEREAQLSGAPVAGAVPPQGFDPARVGAAIDAADGRTVAVPSAGVAPVQPGGAYGALVGGTVPPAGGFGATSAAPLSDAELFDPNRPRGDAPATIVATTSEMIGSSGAISDEQDFNAVSARETIESDAERIARNRANYQIVQPTALPERDGDTGPNIVEYAISTTNAVGEPIHRRSGIRLTSPESACARYRSPDLAQKAFLDSGGPQRDPKGLDPDGDGFACKWDPRPFRTALQ